MPRSEVHDLLRHGSIEHFESVFGYIDVVKRQPQNIFPIWMKIGGQLSGIVNGNDDALVIGNKALSDCARVKGYGRHPVMISQKVAAWGWHQGEKLSQNVHFAVPDHHSRGCPRSPLSKRPVITRSGLTTKVPPSMAARIRATLEMEGSEEAAGAVDAAGVPGRAGVSRPPAGAIGRETEGMLGVMLGMAILYFRLSFTKLEDNS